MPNDSIDIHHIAKLARLELSPEEEQLFHDQLQKVVGHVEKLAELDLSEVEPTNHAGAVMNVLREDTARPGIGQDAVIANAPIGARGQIVVPRVIE